MNHQKEIQVFTTLYSDLDEIYKNHAWSFRELNLPSIEVIKDSKMNQRKYTCDEVPLQLERDALAERPDLSVSLVKENEVENQLTEKNNHRPTLVTGRYRGVTTENVIQFKKRILDRHLLVCKRGESIMEQSKEMNEPQT